MSLSLRDHLSSAGVDKWIGELGVVNAPRARQGITVGLKFFDQFMSRLPPPMAAEFLRATDLSRPVRSIRLSIGERIIAFRKAGEPEFKLFYTRPGNSKHSSGLNPHNRSALHYTVRMACAALESYTTGAIDTWSYPSSMAISVRTNSTGYMAAGGGLQLIVPDAHRYLQLVPVTP
ncbi:MAG: hypothetical protein AAGA03_13820 [Planctomycetota bacterium]